ncbi:rhodanese-like domain-containing protein [uncultured Polaribacter sp.]|uniref:rhodanese-like domain-containing protein n=1 Tax=uncultured Polaribacter sp. TaxID=174711 RepID=UPI002608CDFF|nr:rhodanese-like domain-containing protein [uncultured Polaribacter sp.]
MKKFIFLFLVGILFSSCEAQEEIKTISTQELKTLLVEKNIQLMDVRSPEEIKEGFIQTSMFANYFDADFAEKAAEQLDKTKPVYVVCRSGNRSKKASKILKEKGYQVINVLGGYNQWKKEN